MFGPGNLFVKSLHKSLTTSDLHSAFSRFGSITSALVALDSSGLSKGFGYVAYTNEQDAARALESMDGEWVGVGGNGARVTVRIHEKKDVREAVSSSS
jgi:RNA recognition motif-containing protein